MIFIIIGIVILVLIILCIAIYFLAFSKPKTKEAPPVPPKEEEKEEKKEETSPPLPPSATISSDKSEIHIVVEEPQKTKEKTTDPDEIKKEAEAIGKMLIAKNPSSPLPYKTLGDFYLSKGLKNEATEKYRQAIPLINNSVPYESVKPLENFFRSEGLTNEADSIKKAYT